MAEKSEIVYLFNRNYNPYLINGYTVPERKLEDIHLSEEIPESKRRQLEILAHQVDLRRGKDNFVGVKLAGREIHGNLISWLKNDKGVSVEVLLAVIGSMAGRECIDGIMSAFHSIFAKDFNDKKIKFACAGALDVIICTCADNQQFALGDRIANNIISFCDTAAVQKDSIIDKVHDLAEGSAGKIGKPEYWITHFDNIVQKSPKDISDLFHGKFDFSFDVYCRFPYERFWAYAIAAQIVLNSLNGVITREKALSILLEYSWKTAHYLRAEHYIK